METDQPSGMIAAAAAAGEAAKEVGFEDQAAPPAGEHANATAAVAQADPLQAIFENPEMPEALRLIAGRLGRNEHNTVNAVQLTQSVIQIGANLDHLQKVVQSLSSQQAMAEHQLEYQARGLALDLAIKAMKSENAPVSDPDAIVTLADAFLGYLRGARG